MAKFKPVDTITDIHGSGYAYITIKWVGKDSYQTTGGAWLPIKLVDQFWKIADEEGEIEE